MNPNDGRERRVWRGDWTDGEKALVMEVLNVMPAADLPAMDKVPLIKVDRMEQSPPEQPPPGDEADPVPAPPVRIWHTLAHFSYHISSPRYGVQEKKEFMVSREALAHSSSKTLAAAKRTIAHEIGHVIEMQQYIATARRVHDAVAAHRTLRAKIDEARLATNGEFQVFGPIQQRVLDFDQRIAAESATGSQLHAEYAAAHRAVGLLLQQQADGETVPAASVSAAKAELTTKQQTWQASEARVKGLSEQRTRYFNQTCTPAKQTYEVKLAALQALERGLPGCGDEHVAAQAALQAVYSAADRRTNRLKNFSAMVTTRNIPATLTVYTAASWPDKPGELYAEAYSVFLLEPKALESYSALLYEYFASGAYRNDAG